MSMIAFLALVASWFVLPSVPPAPADVPLRGSSEALPTAA